jgi:hypothetical protein
LNLQPVIPVSLNTNWTLINRVIVPFIHQDDVIAEGSSETGLGDTTASFFFSPAKPGIGGLIRGVGPAFLFPTATDDLLGTEKWGAGPTGVFLWQKHGWTYGALVNHIWSFAGENDRPALSQTFLQPFLSYATKTKTTLSLNSESTYDWGGRTMDCSPQRRHLSIRSSRQNASQLSTRRPLSRRQARQWTGLGLALHHHAIAPRVIGTLRRKELK